MDPKVMNLCENMLKFAEVSNHALRRAVEQNTEYARKEKQASDLIPALVDKLVDLKVLPVEQKQAAFKALGSHAEALNILRNEATKRAAVTGEHATLVEKIASAQQPQRKIGGASPEARDRSYEGTRFAPAEYDSQKSHYIGERTTQKKASDLAFEKILEDPHGS